jgi:hypothetical protein
MEYIFTGVLLLSRHNLKCYLEEVTAVTKPKMDSKKKNAQVLMNVLDLPEEILLYFFTFLDLPQLHNASCVCWTFTRVCRDNSLDWVCLNCVAANLLADK